MFQKYPLLIFLFSKMSALSQYKFNVMIIIINDILVNTISFIICVKQEIFLINKVGGTYVFVNHVIDTKY